MRVAVLGGAGPFGSGLAYRLAFGGAEVRIGSRTPGRAEAAAEEIRRRLDNEGRPAAVAGSANRAAADGADAVFLAVPAAAQEGLIRELGGALRGRLVISCAVLWPPGARPETSAAEEAERALRAAGVPEARVAAAFQTVAAAALHAAPPGGGTDAEGPEQPDAPDAPDALVFADRAEDLRAAARAAAVTGLRAVPAGPLRGVRRAEAAVALLLDLGRAGTARHPGLRITGAAAPLGR